MKSGRSRLQCILTRELKVTDVYNFIPVTKLLYNQEKGHGTHAKDMTELNCKILHIFSCTILLTSSLVRPVKDGMRKIKEDPLTSMNGYLDKKKDKKKLEEAELAKMLKRRDRGSEDKRSQEKRREREKKCDKELQKDKGNKKEKKEKKRKMSEIERLRQERLDREAQERVRAANLVPFRESEQSPAQTSHSHYNSQYNPTISRQYRRDHRW
jgi:flagellar biosynthesis GTPase FlhF